MPDNRPTFQAVREQHGIPLEMLCEDTQLNFETVRSVDTQGIGTPTVIDTLLASLSRLTGQRYDRRSVGGFVFSLMETRKEAPTL